MGGRHRLIIVGYAWSGSRFSGHWTDSLILHALLLALFIPPLSLLHSTAIQGLKKFSKMQLHQTAIRAFGYTVHGESLYADRRRSDYVTAFHLATHLPFQDSHLLPCDT